MNRLLYTESTTDDIDTRIHLMPVSEDYNIDLNKTTNQMLVYRGSAQLGTFIVNGDGNDVSFGLNKLKDYGTGQLQLKLMVQTSEQKIYYPSGKTFISLSISVSNTGKVSLVSLDDSVVNSIYTINQGNNITDDSGNFNHSKSNLSTLDVLNPQLVVGKVEALPYGSQPTVKITKTDQYTLSFDFGIPSGNNASNKTKFWTTHSDKVVAPIVGSWFSDLNDVTDDNLPSIGDYVICKDGSLSEITEIKPTSDNDVYHSTFNTGKIIAYLNTTKVD